MSRLTELYDVLQARGFNSLSGDASADPYAGQTAGNGKLIYSPDEAADNLNRYEVNYTLGNNGALDDGVLTYGFWQSLSEVQNSYYMEEMTDPITGEKFLVDDAYYIQAGYFAPFNAEQQAMAIANMQLWDDLIAVTFQPASSASEADITFGFVAMSPAAGAHAYYPQEEAWDDYYGTVDSGKIGGDVWANWLYSGNYDPTVNDYADLNPGDYAWFAITHELGHSLGLAHGGDYNASDDNDGDGKPDPITYQGDAYFFQDSQQYTIMSYFGGRVTGQSAIDYDKLAFVSPQTPAVHDILAVQNVYGADYTTRAGDTVYGFNSTAGNIVYDFTQNKIPVLTIWDGGGKDTLDLSGFNSNAIIDINEGAFSTAGYKITDAQKASIMSAFGYTTEAQLTAFFARNGVRPDGSPNDNIAIAYGAQIENAIGGSGNDKITGNDLANMLVGNAGNDTFQGGAGNDKIVGGAGNDVLNGGAGNDTLTGGDGFDTYVFADAGVDTINSYQKGERIDLSAFGVTMDDVTINKNGIHIELGATDLDILFNTKTLSTADLYFG